MLLCESTYGDRLHEPDDGGARLAAIVMETAARGGKLIIPAFAIGRVEEVLYWLKRLEDEKRIPVLPVYVDSPMAIEALRLYVSRGRRARRRSCRVGRNGLTAFADADISERARRRVQSADLVNIDQPAIIISSSGMATGGRVLRHLAATLPDPRHTVLFVGYQAAGTRGRRWSTAPDR